VEEELRRRSPDLRIHAQNTEDPTVPYKELLPGHRRSQSGIASRSFLLGQAFGACIILTWYNLYVANSLLWRPPFFLSTLALFHFLEFWTHARYNLPNAYIKSFLLFSNGWMYQAAHGTAMLETILTSLFYPQWQARFSSRIIQATGLALIVIGQAARSVAMGTAATNFNHIVQHQRAMGHELVQHGIYRYLRHPSYFGFFWWAIGTQLVLGNVFGLCLYVVILWGFFNSRIRGK
jgi:protein-S-isoprenylcysteine O-methyltransferase